tara:strand:- start:325 stop:984 length:660 start_codon:yes stop_codon:yes gene_type:complete
MNEKLKALKEIFSEQEYSKYEDIDLNSLVSYVSFILKAHTIPLTFENIYVGSYVSFPKKFCLVNFPEFPDGARINRAILQCTPKYQNLLSGSAKKGYNLTNYGIMKAKSVIRILSSSSKIEDSVKKDENQENRTVDFSKKIKKVKEKIAFKKFLDGKEEEIQANEIFDFLDVSPFDHKKRITGRLNDLEGLAKFGNSDELRSFTRWIRRNKNFRMYLEV